MTPSCGIKVELIEAARESQNALAALRSRCTAFIPRAFPSVPTDQESVREARNSVKWGNMPLAIRRLLIPQDGVIGIHQ